MRLSLGAAGSPPTEIKSEQVENLGYLLSRNEDTGGGMVKLNCPSFLKIAPIMHICFI
jgi:hypothetical protein